jgi:hypothetical protein
MHLRKSGFWVFEFWVEYKTELLNSLFEKFCLICVCVEKRQHSFQFRKTLREFDCGDTLAVFIRQLCSLNEGVDPFVKRWTKLIIIKLFCT